MFYVTIYATETVRVHNSDNLIEIFYSFTWFYDLSHIEHKTASGQLLCLAYFRIKRLQLLRRNPTKMHRSRSATSYAFINIRLLLKTVIIIQNRMEKIEGGLSQRWKNRTNVDVDGTVVAVANRLAVPTISEKS